MKIAARILLAGSFVAAVAATAATVPPAPPAKVGTDADTIQGTRVADPYRWLENWNDPAVKQWSDAQNTRTRSYLDALPYRAKVADKLGKLIRAQSPSYAQVEADGNRVFALYNDPKFQQPMLVTLNAAADPASRKALIDPNATDPKGLTAIDWFSVSYDGSKVALSLSKNGSEEGTLHVYDVASGKEIGKPIDRVQFPTAGGSAAWTKDGSGFWYTRYPGTERPEADRHFYQQVYFHELGSDAAKDPLVLGAKDGLERVSEIFLDTRYGNADGFVWVQRGDGNQWAYYVLPKSGGPAVQIATYADHLAFATLGPDGAVYAISRDGAPNGKILRLKAPFKPMSLGKAPVIVPEIKDAILSGGAEEHQFDLSLSKDRLFVRDIVGGPNEVRVFGLDGKPMGKLPLPQISGNTEIIPLTGGDVLFNVETYLRPTFYAVWHPATGKSEETALKMDSPVSFADAEVVRGFATSKDGTKVPVSIIRRKGLKLDGTHPALIYGYGGYGVSSTPYFLGAMWRLWLDQGGVYVDANIRGGAEYGERWHQGGMLLKKQNVFDDFAACAQYLIDQKYTAHEKLAMMGGSNGGLLMGAEITQHPGLARTVISAVGIYDMVRWENDPNGAFNTPEFGTIKNPEQFKVLYGYSPYHHVVKGTAYPSVLLMTGATDGRVNPMHSRKFAAALQAATSSGLPILLRTSANSGHGIGSSLDERIAERTDELTFLYDRMGVAPK
ncbi:MAG TPA: prolyl oligopeptidase family serine peptidase [Rhizomicrobium sp.]|jgi:prolyl oligopeptidase|nr:prolyl oligopeptidase family serine peptidase [Rhizomicrobium sp.]